MRTTLRSFIACLVFTAMTMFAFGTTYNVGPTRSYTTLQQVQSLLAPGDLVLIDGDATYPGGIYLGQAGTAANPITIRGVRINGNQPILTGGYYGVNIDKAHYNILEGLVFTASTKAAIGVFADQITIRDCVIRDNEKNGIIGYGTGTGSLLVEYTEFFNNGNSAIQPDAHQIYMATDENLYPNAVFRLQYCYMHDGKGGVNVNSRAGRNEIYYNWIEGAYYHELSLMAPDPADNPLVNDNTKREDGDIVGNVLINTTTFAIARLGSDGLGNGSFGRYRFVNNTIIMNGRGEVFRGNLGIGTIEMHNNVVYNTGNASDTRIFYDQETNWSNGRQVIGTNNWIQTGTSMVPAEFTGTISGTNPGFVDLANRNVNLLSTSPLINAANSAPPTIAAYPFINPLFPPLIHPPFHTAPTSPATPRPGVGLLDIGAFEYGSGPACTYSLSASSAAVGIPAGTGSVDLTTLTGCAWATSINVPWLTLTSAANGTGSSTINYSYTANPGGPRTGIISVGGQNFTVNQSGVACTYSLSAANASYASTGGSGSLSVTAITNCEWTAVSSQPWITAPGASGTGNGTVNYTVTANNTNSSRTGTLTIGGQVFTITQAAATGTCMSVTAAGASDWTNATIANQTSSFTVNFDAAVSSATINSAIGLSNGPQFSFTGFGCIMLFDTDGKIKGRDGATYPASTVSYTPGTIYHFRVAVNVATHTYSIYVTAPGGSEQTVGTNYAFRTEQAGITQINNWAATVNYVSAGNMQVCNFSLGTPCSYTLSPASVTPAPSASTGSFTVTTTSTCSWTATSNASWITVTSGATGTGNGTVNYSVALNSGAARTGTISVSGQTFTITQSPAAGCTYSISPSNATVVQTANTGSITVNATTSCPWTAVSNNSWITITSGASGTGNGTVGYSVANNVGPARSGLILVAGNTFAIDQAGSGTCLTMNAGGGWTNTTLTSQTEGFTAEFDASTSNAQLDGLVGLSANAQNAFAGFACIVSFSADGLIKARNGGAYTAASNISYAAGVNYHFRLDINVVNHTYSVYVTPEGGSETLVGANYAFRTEQAAITLINNWGALVNSAAGSIQVCNFSIAAGCSYAISPASASATTSVTTGNFSVTAATGCTWTAVSNAAWISITASASGTGNGTVSYSAAANTGSARSGTITAAGQTFTINQAGVPCTYAISPTSASAVATVTTGSVSVTAGTGCAWTAVSNAAWITVTAGASGTGNGTVSYSAAANTGAARSGTITAAGQTFTINQAAAPCTYAISPTTASATSGATTGSIAVTAGAGCSWTSVSNDAWITITAGATGTGNGTVSYSATANAGSARTGTITAAGQTFTLTQSAIPSGNVDFYTDETSPTVSLVAQQASASIVAEGVGGSNCVKFTGLNSYDKTYRIHYATPKDISGVVGTDKLRISVDMTPATPATTLGINLNGRWDLLIFTGTIDNTTGFQTFDVDISSVRAALGNTINDIYFQPGSGWPTNATLKVDNIKFVSSAPPVCSYTLSTTSASATSALTTGSVGVTAGTGCAWTAVSNDAWLTVTAGASGTGNGTVSYSAAANSGAARTGTITIGGQTFTLTQAATSTSPAEVDLYINDTIPTISFITGTGQLGTGAATTVSTGGVSNSAYMEFTGLTAWDKSKRLHYAVAKDISGVPSTAKLRISVDISTNTAGTGIGIHFNDKYNLVVYTSPADNTPGFQTFEVPISSIRAGLGNTVNDIYFEPSNGWTAGCVVKIDNVQLVSGTGSRMAVTDIISTNPKSETRELAVYPNPADDFVTVALPSPVKKATAIKLVDVNGRIVSNMILQAGATKLNVPTKTLRSGMYNLIIATEKGNVVRKIVVSH